MSEPAKIDCVFIGVHLQSDGVVVLAVSDEGQEIATARVPFVRSVKDPLPKGFKEEQPEIWWDATRLALGRLTTLLRDRRIAPGQVRAVSVCCDPGVLIVMDRAGRVISPAILREDIRGADQLVRLNAMGAEHAKKMGFAFSATDVIAKIAWLKENMPDLYDSAIFVHQLDYLLGRLKGTPDVTEFTTSMYTGCDLIDECWPDWLDYDMHLGVRERLPRLVPVGTVVGKVSSAASASTGLPQGVVVVMGGTTDTATFLASGARRLGDFSTILEEGLAIRGITKRILSYPRHLVRMSKLPDHVWYFATACSTGAGWIKDWFKDANIEEIEQEAQKLLPTSYLAYPNTRKGETFPFCSSSAEGFISPATDNRVVQFASCMQGTAFFERLSYQKLDKLAEFQNNQGNVYTGGPWRHNDPWMQCRADVTGRVNYRTATPDQEAAFGTAVIASIGSHFKKFEEAADSMLHVDRAFFPDPDRIAPYLERYNSFLGVLEEQGYM